MILKLTITDLYQPVSAAKYKSSAGPESVFFEKDLICLKEKYPVFSRADC